MSATSSRSDRLYAATGDAVATLVESDGGWTVELSLGGSGVQCIAPDPADPDGVHAGLREPTARRRDGRP